MKGPGYTLKDLFYWGGLIVGGALVYKVLESFTFLGAEPRGSPWRILHVGGSLLVGAGLGYVLERMYTGPSETPPSAGAPPGGP